MTNLTKVIDNCIAGIMSVGKMQKKPKDKPKTEKKPEECKHNLKRINTGVKSELNLRFISYIKRCSKCGEEFYDFGDMEFVEIKGQKGKSVLRKYYEQFSPRFYKKFEKIAQAFKKEEINPEDYRRGIGRPYKD